MTFTHRVFSAWLTVAVFSFCTTAQGVLSRFQPLGDLDGGAFRSFASSVSADGTVVVGGGTFLNEPSSEPTIWTRPSLQIETLSEILVDDGFSRSSDEVSSDGTTIAGTAFLRSSATDEGAEAFRWTSASGFDQLMPLVDAVSATVSGMSADGAVVVGTSRNDSNVSTAVLWGADGTVESLGALPTSPLPASSVATGISADGSVITGTTTSGFGQEGFIWTLSEGMVGLGDLPGRSFSSQADAISSDGSTIVGFGSPESDEIGSEAMRWTAAGGMQGLGLLRNADMLSSATVVSSDGSIVFGASSGLDDSRAFVWEETMGMRDLVGVLTSDYGLGTDLDGWSEITPRDISEDSLVIVGSGINPNGNLEGWVVTLDRPIGVPEPGCLAILAMLALPNLVVQRSRRVAGVGAEGVAPGV